MQSTNHSIPHVDMRRYDEDFQAFTKDVGNGYEEYGFIALTNHGVDTQLIERALDTCRELFALPEDVKMKYHRPEKVVHGVIRRLVPRLQKMQNMSI